MPDGCGGSLSCGSCTSPAICGVIAPNVCGPVYQNSFESSADFPAGWTYFENCAATTNWAVTRVTYPAPNGGSFGLRMASTPFVPGCQSPGVYAASPPITAQPGRVYRTESWSRNSSFAGTTSLHFYDSADKEIGSQFAAWSADSWTWNADPPASVTAPAGTAKLRVRFSLNSPSATADLDLLKVFADP